MQKKIISLRWSFSEKQFEISDYHNFMPTALVGIKQRDDSTVGAILW